MLFSLHIYLFTDLTSQSQILKFSYFVLLLTFYSRVQGPLGELGLPGPMGEAGEQVKCLC